MKSLEVRDAINKFDVAFVSSIRTYGNLGPFRPNNRADFCGVRLFDLLLRPDQIVCGTTVRASDGSADLYGNWGVILGKGSILQAFPYDATSSVNNGVASSPYDWRISEDIESQVRHAIEYRQGYNEFNIALGKRSIAGLFFGEAHRGYDGIDLPSDEVLDLIKPLNTPSYTLQAGKFHRIAPSGEIASASTPAAEIANTRVEVDSQTAAVLTHDLADKLCFAPRNAVSAGILHGRIAADERDHHQVEAFTRLLQNERIDRRTFGAVALHTYPYQSGNSSYHPNETMPEQAYAKYLARLMPNGTLRASEADITYYLEHGSAPAEYGKI